MTNTKTLGTSLLFSGVLLPAIVYVGEHLYLANIASYGGPPDQGAMLMAYIAFRISCVIGGCLALAGFTLLVMSRHGRPNART